MTMPQESTFNKFIVFRLADMLLALPMQYVVRVVSYPGGASHPMQAMGLVQLGHHTIRVVNLHQQMGGGEGLPASSPPFLAIARGFQGEFWGVAVDEPPNLMELPLERMQSLPTADTQTGILALVSHAIVLSESETIFLLDLHRVFANATNAVPQRSLAPWDSSRGAGAIGAVMPGS